MKFNRKQLSIITILLVLTNTLFAQNKQIKQIDSLMKWSNQIGVFNGNVLVSKNNKIIYNASFGFTDAKIPVDVKVIDITQGETKSILLFGGNNIGGGNSGTPRPSKGGWFGDSATDYKGTIQVEVTYSDGTTEKGDEFNWTIRKNKG